MEALTIIIYLDTMQYKLDHFTHMAQSTWAVSLQ